MDELTLAGIVQDCFPEVRVRNVTQLQEGWANFVIEVNYELIFRFPKRSEVEDNLRKEIRLLPKLAEHLKFRVPRFDFVWEGGDEYDGWFVGYMKIRGVPIGRWCTRKPHTAKMVGQLASMLTEIHSFPAKRFAGLRLEDFGPMKRRDKFEDLYAQVMEKVLPVLNAKERRKVIDFFERQLAVQENFRFDSTFTHDDLSGPHILCDKTKDMITGVIDWEDGCIGDPAGDFYGILEDCGPSFTKKVLEKYEGEPDPGIMRRVRLYLGVVPFYEVLYGQEHDEATARFGLARLRSTILR
jgi:aminoglycoside 2''-phosphotransferase